MSKLGVIGYFQDSAHFASEFGNFLILIIIKSVSVSVMINVLQPPRVLRVYEV